MILNSKYSVILLVAIIIFLPMLSKGQLTPGNRYIFSLYEAGSEPLINIDSWNPSQAWADTAIVTPGIIYTIRIEATSGVTTRVSNSPKSLSLHTRTTVDFITHSPPVFYEGIMHYEVLAQVNAHQDLIQNSSASLNDPTGVYVSGSVHEEYSGTRARASLFVSNSTTARHIEVETHHQNHISGTYYNTKALSNFLRVYYFSVGDTTTIRSYAAPNALDCGEESMVVGSSACNVIFPVNTIPPYEFPEIPSGSWFDPPTTYGYRYEVSDALITAVLGWSPEVSNPVRVSVAGVDLGLVNGEIFRFSDYTSQLGGLLVDGLGVVSFEITEISPLIFSSDPLGYPIQLEYSEPSTSTMVMTPLTEPAMSGVASDQQIPWASISASASPNPFNPSVRIAYTLAEPSEVSVSVYDLRGLLVRRLVSNLAQSADVHSVIWRGDDMSGIAVSSGTYFVRIDAGGQHGIVKATLLK